MIVGLVCGMQSELRALAGLRDHPHLRISVSGARPERAEAAARRLVEEGCRALVSWGIAGGLNPALPRGILLTGSAVTDGTRSWPLADPDGVLLLGSDRPVASVAEKQRLFRNTAAEAVDMETHRLARVGAEADLPVHAIRAVADPAGRDLPALALDALDEDGRPRVGAVLRRLLRRPGDLPGLLRLKRDTDAALARLAEAAAEVAALLEA